MNEDGHGSKANFKSYCTDMEGSFSSDGLGNTKCIYSTGGSTKCVANGNDCWCTPREENAV